jgi:flagellar motor protein MotB
VTVGYGESQLKKPDVPNDPANRRVQVVNMADKTASK